MTFLNFLEKDMYVYINSQFYYLGRASHDYLQWYSQRHPIAKAKLSSLEELTDFAVNKVIEKSNGNHFFYRDNLFEILESRNSNHIKLNNTTYSIGSLEGKARTIKDRFYNKENNLGFERNDFGFFIYTLVEPYILYERKNRKYYKFDRAKIGVELIGKAWKDPIIINPYSHPALRYKNKDFQKICNGSCDYNAIRKKYRLEDQIKVVLEKARHMILRGYFSQKGSWHSLTEPIFREHIVCNPDKGMVSNL